jgi:antitoxin HicB
MRHSDVARTLEGRYEMGHQKKLFDYYLSLEYPMEFEKLPDDEGGGFAACIPDLGRDSCVGYGKTLSGAYRSLMVAKAEVIREALELGQEIREPSPDLDAYSGVFLVRTTKELHYALVKQAEAQGVSLNHLVSSLLAAGGSLTAVVRAATEDLAAAARGAGAIPRERDWDQERLEERPLDTKRTSLTWSTGYGEVVQ